MNIHNGKTYHSPKLKHLTLLLDKFNRACSTCKFLSLKAKLCEGFEGSWYVEVVGGLLFSFKVFLVYQELWPSDFLVTQKKVSGLKTWPTIIVPLKKQLGVSLTFWSLNVPEPTLPNFHSSGFPTEKFSVSEEKKFGKIESWCISQSEKRG